MDRFEGEKKGMNSMSNEDKVYQLIEQMYSEIRGEFNGLRAEVNDLRAEVNEVKTEARKTNLTIENDIKPKIDALFDGYKQNTDKLNRIEAEVVKHEEFIIKRIK